MTLIGFIFSTLNSAFFCDLSYFDNFLKCLLRKSKLLNVSSDNLSGLWSHKIHKLNNISLVQHLMVEWTSMHFEV
jgi:hypothetical protein